MQISEKCSAIINDVFTRLLSCNQNLYSGTLGSHLDLPDYLQFPKGIGGIAYKDDVTAYRIMGADRAYPQPKARDVPQELINQYCRSFSQGLELAFPIMSITEYLGYKLEEESFSHYKTTGGRKSRIEEYFLVDFPNILINEPKIPNIGNLKNSWEFDIRRDFSETTNMLSTRRDRKQLSNKDILNFYQFSVDHPELIAAFLLWQEHIADYCSELKVLENEHFYSIYKECDFDRPIELFLEEVFPITHVIEITNSSIIMSNISLFFGAAITAYKSDKPLSPSVLNEGIIASKKAGIFARYYQSEFGERQIICPWASASVRWLLHDMEKEGCNKSIISHYYDKILKEKNDPKVDKVLCDIQDSIREILNSTNLEQISKVKKQSHNGCPFNYK